MKLVSSIILSLVIASGTQASNLRATSLKNNRNLGSACSAKKVRISMFKIEGDIDAWDAEIKLSLMGSHYFPTDGRKYAPFEEGKSYRIDGEWKEIQSHKVLTVGATEVDMFDDDHYSASLQSKEWHSDTCEPYELIVTKTIDNGSKSEICFNVGAGGDSKGVDLDGGVKYCCEWTEPEESIFWHVEVMPKDSNGESFSPACLID